MMSGSVFNKMQQQVNGNQHGIYYKSYQRLLSLATVFGVHVVFSKAAYKHMQRFLRVPASVLMANSISALLSVQ